MNERKKNTPRPPYRKPSFTQRLPRQEVEKKVYDNADMMQMFNVTSRTLQRWRDEGIVPFRKIGGLIFYPASKIDRMMGVGEEDDDE